jgi:sugar (pentulose or hexulose) kinase
MTKGFLGIDAGTQGLSVIFSDESLKVLAMGEGTYEMVPGLEEGCYEQLPTDWQAALTAAMEQLRANLSGEMEVLSIGISGQMHGEVLADADAKSLGPARLWCDARNEAEEVELTESLGTKMPKRITAARWLWTIRNRPEIAKQAARMTTPAGWIAYQLTGQWNLGIGDAAGMFPIDQATLDYDQSLLEKFDATSGGPKSLKDLLPNVRKAGEDGGTLSEPGAAMLGLPAGIPVAPAEGDQPAALAGSLIGEAGMVSCSFGTSVCANSVGDRAFEGVSKSVDHFCAPDGKPINMVWLRNGTTYMNCVVEMFGQALGGDRSAGFDAVIPQVLTADADCGGLIALPFMDDEPGLGVSQGGTAMLVGLNSENATPGNAVKAALLSTMFNLKLGSETLDTQGFPRTELVLSGGLTKTPKLAQNLADVFNTPVTLLESAEEGTAWGAALMAKFRFAKIDGEAKTWSEFLNDHMTAGRTQFQPIAENVSKLESVFQRYKKLLQAHSPIDNAMNSDPA